MRFAVFTHVEHIREADLIYAYSPYVREMKLWFSHVGEVEIVGPTISRKLNSIYIPYQQDNLVFNSIPAFNLLSLKGSFQALFKIPLIVYRIFGAMYRSDHIHLRCPGNIGLIACFVQMLFPHKPKTVKYAGNWDPNSKQPWSYRLQKLMLSNTFLSRNIKVLVYGKWPGQSKNIFPFFTASFSDVEKLEIQKEFKPPYKLLFVGSLVPGKNPFFAIQLIEFLMSKGVPVKLEYYGDGLLKKELQSYIETKNLEPFVCLMGNQKKEVLKEAYQNSHFLVLASKSEGWPKAVAEAMFFGCIPFATGVSCVPWMLGAPPASRNKYGTGSEGGAKEITFAKRGVLIQDLEQRKEKRKKGRAMKVERGKWRVESGNRGKWIEESLDKIIELIRDPEEMKRKSLAGQEWSQQYTLEKFESEIKKLL